jgi:hypothetical protein
MDHGFYGVDIQFIDEDCVIMMHIGLNDPVDAVTEEKRFVVEIYLYKHVADEDTGYGIRYKGQGTRDKGKRL